MDRISALKKELEKAVLHEDFERAEEISDELFRLQGGKEEYTEMPIRFAEEIKKRSEQKSGGQKKMNMKKIEWKGIGYCRPSQFLRLGKCAFGIGRRLDVVFRQYYGWGIAGICGFLWFFKDKIA